MSLVKKVQNTVFQQELFKRGDKIILAVSGGPDSVCLLDTFAKLQKKYSLELLIAHVNYGLRGKDSDKDEQLVRELGEKYGIRISVLNAFTTPPSRPSSTTPPQPSPEYRGGGGNALSENALRDVRYDFFEKLRAENKFDLIAVAHNADDQVETFLMRVIRGAGLQGLAAMQFKNNFLIRPLLAESRAEIIDYLKENKLAYRIDKTNLKNDFLRNKIRNKLLPYLEKDYNPNIRKTLFTEIQAIAADYAFIASSAKATMPVKATLKVSRVMSLHPALQKQVLRNALSCVKADLKDIEAAHIEEIIKILKSTKNKHQLVSFKGLKVTRKGDKLEISCKS
ncbi:MAG: tRNA lysidine(34) synthetase TilS [Parcubacteria group bacterium]